MSILGSLTNSLGITGTSEQLANTSGLTPDEALELKVKDAYYRMQLEKQAQAAQQAYNTSIQPGGFYPSTASSWTTLGMQTSTQTAFPSIKLDEGAWDVPISQLVDLWTVRYGSKWVDDSELDDFYKVASQRLRTLNKLESHYLNGKDVYRIVE